MRTATGAVLLLALCAAGAAAEELPAIPEIVIAGPKPLPAVAPAPEAAEAAVLRQERIAGDPQQTVDDLLRTVPGFSLFRRTSSLVAHPTAQGVSLRGVGGSGASRALVLLDGIPLHDPFGGWIAWSRIPRIALSKIEVQQGWGAHRWGGYALTGRIEAETLSAKQRRAELAAEAGSFDTWSLSTAAAGGSQALSMLAAAEVFDTRGFNQLAPDDRGPIDERAASEHQTVFGKAELALSDRTAARFSASFFNEDRDNGTPYTKNSTETASLAASMLHRLHEMQQLELQAYLISQGFSSTFSSQAPDRGSETPALDQFSVPSTALGAAGAWTFSGPRHTAEAGSDIRWLHGTTNEELRFMQGSFTRDRKASADQIVWGVYLGATRILSPRLTLTALLRGDLLRTFDLMRRERDLASGETLSGTSPAAETELLLSPKLGAALRLTGESELFFSLYQNVRTPTINELVRPFRVRNDITEANAGLGSEMLQGAELGLRFLGESWRASITGYAGEVQEPIINQTVGFGPGEVQVCGFVPEGGVCRRRENVGEALLRGWQARIERSIGESWDLEGAYLFSDSELHDAGPLNGKRLAQAPQHSGLLGLRFHHEATFRAVLQLRAQGEQLEDDLGSLSLPGYATVDAAVARRLSKSSELFIKAENLLDREYAVAKTADGTTTRGLPFFVHAGVRFRF